VIPALLVLFGAAAANGQEAAFNELARSYSASIRGLITRHCGECHAKDRTEAEIDLTAFATLDDVRKGTPVWQKVGEMLDSGQMPPKDAKQPSDEARTELRNWVRSFLKAEARASAGDPGPVVLRRLNSAEFTYAVRDLTGVPLLQPAREFPVDGAAGEGFTNAGQALVMSPSLVTKYLDAGKEVAAHAMLLPTGIRFSPSTTRRDWTDEILAEIRQLYARHTDATAGSKVNLQGIVFDTNGGGRLPVEKYMLATLAEREALRSGKQSVSAVAKERGLSPKYLTALWTLLHSEPGGEQPKSASTASPIGALRARWRVAKPEDAAGLAADVARWQQSLWRFTSVGHIGKLDGPTAWMEPANPLTARQDLRLKLSPATTGEVTTLYLSATDAGDGNEQDFVVWERPRLVAPGRPDLLLRDVRTLTRDLIARRERIVATVAQCLAAASEAGPGEIDVAALAGQHGVDSDVLAAWLDYLGIRGPAKLGEPITGRQTNGAGFDFIQGWTGDNALSVVANSSDRHVRIPGNMPPHSVAVHPAPTKQVAVAWRGPAAMPVQISAAVRHAHPECGNGVQWSVELWRGNTRQPLAAGTAQGAKDAKVGPLEKLAVKSGDLVVLLIGPRDGNHSCDLTAVDLTLTSGERQWNLARDVSANILAGNPHADGQGNADVWHFFSEPATGSTKQVIPAGSLLARWQAADDRGEKQRLAEEIQRLLQGGVSSLPKDSPDVALYKQVTSLSGLPFSASLLSPAKLVAQPGASESVFGIDPQQFGKHPSGSAIEAASLCVRAPAVVEIRLPAELLEGVEFVTAGSLHAQSGGEGSVQLQVGTAKPQAAAGLQPAQLQESRANAPWTSNNQRIDYAAPVIVRDGSAARRRIEKGFDEFRRWFPAAVCYPKIVPVDEVVTLTLFYREDDHLRRLLLDDGETARLNRLWEELHFVSQDALTLVDAFEQLWQYATQDANPKVFEPLRKPIADRALAFRRELTAAEPRHLEAVLEFAQRAFRRPLRESEARDLLSLYQTLRNEELAHDDAIRLLLARVLVSPAFLYRTEQSRPRAALPAGPSVPSGPVPAHPVTDEELATRLSFFLWSSIPDAELRSAAARGKLHQPDELIAQTRRMVKEDLARRLATEFACQWLHIYEFDSHDEKSPAAFPTFAGLRGAMYEESIRFFTDILQRDGSVLELLDADHTFFNEALAQHYDIAGVTGDEWRRVDGIKQQGRGGILGMATTLSKQSGASRTSPVLRGAWVSEVLLGEKLPKPPKGVPQLPETVPAGLTERQLVEQHTSAAACAKCHMRIDAFGFALENFDAIGRLRSGPGSPAVNTRTRLVDGTEIDGVSGLRSYLLTNRRDDFVRQFCKKLLGYALGRAVQLSDEPLLDEMQAELKANHYRVWIALEAIVRSRQFQTVRDVSE